MDAGCFDHRGPIQIGGKLRRAWRRTFQRIVDLRRRIRSEKERCHRPENQYGPVFGNVTASLGERTKLSGGLRHIWYQTEAGANLCGNIDFTGCFANPALQTDLKTEATIYQLSAQHFLSDEVMVYASFGTSWRPDAQFIGGSSFPTPRQAELARTPPEESSNYEIGLKSTFMEGRLRFNLTGYYQEFDNYPYRAPGSGVFGIRYAQPGSGQAATVQDDNYLSAVPVEVKGLEAEIAFDILKNWKISGILSYADGKIKNGSIACLDLDGDGMPDGAGDGRPSVTQIEQSLGGDGNPATADTPGVALCNVSQRSASSSPFAATLTTEYVHPVSTNTEAVARALYSFRGNSIGDPTNPRDSVSSYGLLNLYAGLRGPDRSWEITGYVKNVFDTFRVLTRDREAAATQIAGGTAFDLTNYFNINSTAPREFGITARFAFGSR